MPPTARLREAEKADAPVSEEKAASVGRPPRSEMMLPVRPIVQIECG